MGAVWLASMPQVLRDAGLDVDTYPGWETRSRSSGGYDDVYAIGMHHDAIRAGTSTEARCGAAWDRHIYRPVGAIILTRGGKVVVGAAGATNTQGRGGPYPCSKGVVPLNQGNRYMLAIEAENDGVGEPWPAVQILAYLKLCRALCDWLGLDPLTDIVAHFEYTNPGADVNSDSHRKIDPADVPLSTKYGLAGAVYKGMFDMPLFRNDTATLNPGDDDMTPLNPPVRPIDTRLDSSEFPRLKKNVPVRLPVVLGQQAFLHFTVVGAAHGGYLTASPTREGLFQTSIVNFTGSDTAHDGGPFTCPDGHIWVVATADCDLIVDTLAQ